MPEPSAMDVEHLALIRENVRRLIDRVAGMAPRAGRVLDVAPQDHEGAGPHFPDATVDTIDIDPDAGCTYVGDICRHNAAIPDSHYDVVVCTEVLEHVLQPFDAVAELRRVLRPGGLLAVSTPFNFRVHGPLPDCWRFTEHGLRALLSDFDIVRLDALETPDRPLMPIHHTVIAARPADRG
ncbi:MAG: methyltransferase domain-containing protein [Actinomycetota bacterium]